MSLQAFNEQGRVVAIHSRILGCEVILAADGAVLPATEARPVYRVEELVALLQGELSAEGLRQVHATKVVFSGRVLTEEDLASISPGVGAPPAVVQ